MEGLPATTWAAIAAAVAGFFSWVATRHRDRANATAIISTTSIEWIHELRDETVRLRTRLGEVEAEVKDCETKHDLLITHITALEAALVQVGLDVPRINGNDTDE